MRYRAAARLLRSAPRGDGGRLAVVETQHVLPDDGDPFFAAVQKDYAATLPEAPKTKAGPPAAPGRRRDLRDEIARSGLFAPAVVRRHRWDVTFTAAGYLELVGSFSDTRALDERTRRLLLARIGRRIESRPEGTVRKTSLATLTVAERG